MNGRRLVAYTRQASSTDTDMWVYLFTTDNATFAVRNEIFSDLSNSWGNASPAILDVNCRMGGADIDLNGDWRNDSSIDLSIRMGGMSVLAPRGLRIEGVPTIPTRGIATEQEVPVQTLRFRRI